MRNVHVRLVLAADATLAVVAAGWVYTEGLANYAIEKMRSDFVKNGSDQTLGNFDNARLQRMIEIVTPIFTAQNQPPKSGLKPEDIATNEFIDTSIGVPA